MKRFDPGILLVLFIIGIIILASIFFYFQIRTDLVSEYVEQEKEIPLAFIINDENRVLISELVIYHPGTHKTAIIDAPPYTGTLIKSLERIDRMDKVFETGRIKEYLAEMEKLFDTDIPFYIQISLDELKNFISVLGGIEVFIANPVEKITDDEIVLLPSGRVNLDGDKATIFISYVDENDNSEEIIGRKQKFLQALLFSIGRQKDMFRKKNAFSILSHYFSSNLNKQALLSLFSEYSNIDQDAMARIETLGKIRKIDDIELLFPLTEGQLIKETVAQALKSLRNIGIPGTDDLVIVLEILNGTTITGLASRTSQLFKSYGYDVDVHGNAETDDLEHTVVIDRIGNISLAKRVASVINCERIESEIYTENTSGIDVTVVLGKDFDERTVKH
ncbi:MAG: LCP family protein [Spirochaetales bacterium]|nr:LCP family protein [Spirochaetales bacterium]